MLPDGPARMFLKIVERAVIVYEELSDGST
jgi:hypothetical protein